MKTPLTTEDLERAIRLIEAGDSRKAELADCLREAVGEMQKLMDIDGNTMSFYSPHLPALIMRSKQALKDNES